MADAAPDNVTPAGDAVAASASAPVEGGAFTPAPPIRYHGFDALRAIAMLLGIALHAAIAYVTIPVEGWAVTDAAPSPAADLFVFIVHAFRMQVFFVMAGFFGRLVIERRGTRAFVRHRLIRIALPLVVSVLLLVPICRAVWAWGLMRGADVEVTVVGLLAGTIGDLEMFTPLFHFWFLQSLLVFYAVVLGIRAGLARLGATGTRVTEAFDRPFRAVLRSAWARPVVVAIPVTLILALLPQWWIDDAGQTMLPPWPNLVHDGFWFLLGWGLHRVRHEVMDRLGLGAVGSLMAAVVVAFGLGMLVEMSVGRREMAFASEAVFEWCGRGASALFTSLLVFGVMGVFTDRIDRPSRTLRYVADSSYWLYLVHLPLVVAAGIVVAPTAWPAAVKLAVVLGVTTPIMFVTYQLAVRHTVIGWVLNGRR